MNWDLIKKSISKEIQSTIHAIDPAINIDGCLNLYINILKLKISIPTSDDLDGLENTISETLSKYFVDCQINNTLVGIFCKSFEPFVKKIYYILEENEYVNNELILDNSKLKTLTPFLSIFNKIRPIYLDSENKDVYELELAAYESAQPKFKIDSATGLKTYKRLYPNNIKFDKYSNINDQELNEKFQGEFILYLIKAIILKNEQSHQAPESSRIENVTNFNTTLIAELWLIDFFGKELTNSIKRDGYKKREFDEYINSEIESLKKQSSKFVSLNLKELTNQSTIGVSGFIENILSDNLYRMRILGQGGSGKTTTLQYLLFNDAMRWIENPINSKIPVLISMANTSYKETIVESIAKKMNVDVDYIEELLETNQLKVYLDGINEIGKDTEFKKTKLQEISQLIEEYPELNILITDRFEFDSYQNNMFKIPTFLIQKLNKDQIQEFVMKYCNNSIIQSEHVLKVLKSIHEIQELLLRPLVLTRAIEIIKVDDELPKKEGQIIEKFIDILLRREKDEKKDPLLNINNFKLLLSYAANEIWTEHKSNIAVHEFKFNKMFVDAAEKYGLEKFNVGYITRIAYELEILSKNNELIQFYHQSYIEFFCKHYLKYELH